MGLVQRKGEHPKKTDVKRKVAQKSDARAPSNPVHVFKLFICGVLVVYAVVRAHRTLWHKPEPTMLESVINGAKSYLYEELVPWPVRKYLSYEDSSLPWPLGN